MAAAMGRKVDEHIINAALTGATQLITVNASGLTRGKALQAVEILNKNEVPMTDRFAVIGPHQWSELLTLPEFANADLIGKGTMPWVEGYEARRWLGVTWIMHNMLPLNGNTRKCFIFHRSAIGLAEGLNIDIKVSYENDRRAWLATAAMSVGAVRIDDNGVVVVEADDTTTIS